MCSVEGQSSLAHLEWEEGKLQGARAVNSHQLPGQRLRQGPILQRRVQQRRAALDQLPCALPLQGYCLQYTKDLMYHACQKVQYCPDTVLRMTKANA